MPRGLSCPQTTRIRACGAVLVLWVGCSGCSASREIDASFEPEASHSVSSGDRRVEDDVEVPNDAAEPPGGYRFEWAQDWAPLFDDPLRDEWQKPEVVIEFLQLAPDQVVADIGAGTGYFSVKLAAAVPEGKVLANDVEPDMVRHLAERARALGLSNLVAVQGSAFSPELPEPAHVMFLSDVYHHMPDTRIAYFEQARTQLEQDGKLVIVEGFETDDPADRELSPCIHLSPDDLIAELQQAGWKHVRTDADSLPRHYLVEFVPE